MPNIRLFPWVLVVGVLVASAAAFGWSEPRLAPTGLPIATPPSAPLVRTAIHELRPIREIKKAATWCRNCAAFRRVKRRR